VPGTTNAGSSRGLRGGSWNNNENNLRASNRNNNDPTNENNNVGFRVARPPKNAGPSGPICEGGIKLPQQRRLGDQPGILSRREKSRRVE